MRAKPVVTPESRVLISTIRERVSCFMIRTKTQMLVVSPIARLNERHIRQCQSEVKIGENPQADGRPNTKIRMAYLFNLMLHTTWNELASGPRSGAKNWRNVSKRHLAGN